MGSIDFVRVGTSMLVDFGMDELKAINVPFLFRDREHCWKVLGGEIGQKLKEDVNKRDTGLVGLWFAEEGMRHMIFKDGPVTKLADFKGRKIRVNNVNMLIDMINAMGASAVPMAYTEVYTSLQTGVIDGLENIAVGYQQSALYEVAPYYTLDGHTPPFVWCAHPRRPGIN
jgi:TRAP-type C4-dicarboxylate transport system substrate-binding protein